MRHTLEVQTKISQIWSLLQDAEIGQRSFVLTGTERFCGTARQGERSGWLPSWMN